MDKYNPFPAQLAHKQDAHLQQSQSLHKKDTKKLKPKVDFTSPIGVKPKADPEKVIMDDTRQFIDKTLV